MLAFGVGNLRRSAVAVSYTHLDVYKRKLFVVVSHVVDPRADGIAPHQPSIAGLQQIGRLAHILHAGINGLRGTGSSP